MFHCNINEFKAKHVYVVKQERDFLILICLSSSSFDGFSFDYVLWCIIHYNIIYFLHRQNMNIDVDDSHCVCLLIGLVGGSQHL